MLKGIFLLSACMAAGITATAGNDKDICDDSDNCKQSPASVYFEKYTISISDVETSCRLKFSSVSSSDSKQCFFLDEIKVEKSIPAGIVSVENNVNKSHYEIYTIAGQHVNAVSANTLPKGIYIINGKKIVIK